MNNPNQIIPQLQAVSARETKVYQSRWGYHPVSKEDFRFLRAVSRRYWETLARAYRWATWKAKDPKNRLGPEPTTDERFIDRNKRSWFSVVTKDGGCRTHALRFARLFECVVKDLREARTPRMTPAEVKPVDMSKYEALRAAIQLPKQ